MIGVFNGQIENMFVRGVPTVLYHVTVEDEYGTMATAVSEISTKDAYYKAWRLYKHELAMRMINILYNSHMLDYLVPSRA